LVAVQPALRVRPRVRLPVRLPAWLLAGLLHSVGAQPLPSPGTPPGPLPDAAALQSLERQQRERQREDERLQRQPARPPVAVPPTPESAAPAGGPRIAVRRIETGASAILSAERLRAAVAPFEGRTLTLAELQQAVQAINALYAAAGAPTARALLPAQDVDGGLVRITLVESRIGEVRLGPTRLAADAVLPRLGLAEGDLVSVPQIEDALQRFNRISAVQLAATLAAGRRTGTTDVLLQPTDPPLRQWTLFGDNAGSPSLGSARLGLALRMPLPTPAGDSLSASVMATGAAPSPSLSLAWQRPLGEHHLLEASAALGRIEVRRGPFAALDVRSRSGEVGLGLTRRLWLAPEGLWSAGLRLAGRNAATQVAGVEQQHQQLRLLTLRTDLERLDETGSWTADLAVVQGLRAAGGDMRYRLLRASAARLQRLDGGQQLLLRSALQWTDEAALPGSEEDRKSVV
jgi:hemolysin activation/secretion protein